MSYLPGRNRSRSRATFEEACPPLHRSEDEYARERRQAYPTATRHNQHPDPDEQRSYRRYKVFQEVAQSAEVAYEKEAAKVMTDYDRVVDGSQIMREYYRETSDSLLPRHHGELLAPAADLEELTYRHANARADHFVAHPRGYVTAEDYGEHRHHAIRAYKKHEAFNGLHREHDRLALDPYSEDRDLYGNAVSRTLKPAPGWYPPAPPPDRYLTGGPSIAEMKRKPVVFEMKPRSSR